MHVLVPHMSCVCGPNELQEAIAANFKEIYIVTSQGVFKHHQLRGEGRYVRLKVDKIPGYKEEVVTQEVCYLPAGKIPYSLWEQVVGFFKKVIEVKKEELEAMIHILWNAERGYHIGVPPQTVSKASATYDWSYLPPGTTIACDIHSHNSMSAFFSGTDNRDDKNSIGFSAVVGKLKDKEPMVVIRFNYYETKVDVKLSDVIEMPSAPAIDIPDEWMTNVKTPVYAGHNRGSQGFYSPTAGKFINKTDTYPVGTPQWVKDKDKREQVEALAKNNLNGNRIGPSLRNSPHTFTNATEDFNFDDVGYDMGEVWGALALASQSPVEKAAEKPSQKSAINASQRDESDSEYAFLLIQHGNEVADAVTLINDCMPTLEGKNDLIEEIVSDLFQMADGNDQLEMIRKLCSELPSESRDKLMNSGL